MKAGYNQHMAYNKHSFSSFENEILLSYMSELHNGQ